MTLYAITLPNMNMLSNKRTRDEVYDETSSHRKLSPPSFSSRGSDISNPNKFSANDEEKGEKGEKVEINTITLLLQTRTMQNFVNKKTALQLTRINKKLFQLIKSHIEQENIFSLSQIKSIQKYTPKKAQFCQISPHHHPPSSLIDNLPSSVTHLHLLHYFNQPIDNLPASVIYLELGIAFKHSFPPSITHLAQRCLNIPVQEVLKHLPSPLPSTISRFSVVMYVSANTVPTTFNQKTFEEYFGVPINILPPSLGCFSFGSHGSYYRRSDSSEILFVQI
eukprot:TRINITY_DN4991_c0_g2_i1.p1 TRINITY_DN4991_c0_g2~~TRINITY_DN4991_c0_g2_i1.p1  ORF type:complete len:279 (+),score=38.39 TRINITY_DN4991_c0_g2_i1:89-925(+)